MLQEPLGTDLGPFVGPSWPPKPVPKALQHELNFSVLFKRPTRRTPNPDAGSPGLEADRWGGVGEGL